jgi:hypothetical protein
MAVKQVRRGFAGVELEWRCGKRLDQSALGSRHVGPRVVGRGLAWTKKRTTWSQDEFPGFNGASANGLTRYADDLPLLRLSLGERSANSWDAAANLHNVVAW